MKKLTLLLCLFGMGLVSMSYAQNVSIEKIENLDNENKASGQVGDIISLQVKAASVAPLLNQAIYLYLNGSRTGVTAFVQDTTKRRWYFRLQSEQLGTLLAPFPNKQEVRMGIGTYSEYLTPNLAGPNFTLVLEAVKARLLNDSLNITLTDPVEIQILDELAFNDLKAQDPKNLAIYLNNIVMSKSKHLSTNFANRTMTFLLNENEVVKWFYNPLRGTSLATVSLGNKTDSMYDVAGKLYVRFYTLWDRLGGLLIPLLGLYALFLISSRSNLIRDPVIPAGAKYAPFSFSRTQLAFWTFVILSSFIFIWFTTKELAFFPNSALILLGLSVSVTAAARIIDSDSSGQKGKQSTRIQIDEDNSSLRDKWNMFFSDLLSDGAGVSIHRLQNLVFNMFLGLVFFRGVWVNLEMPSFSNELLALMGVSAAAYTGVKAFEKPSSDTPSNTTPPKPVETPTPSQPTPPTPPPPKNTDTDKNTDKPT